MGLFDADVFPDGVIRTVGLERKYVHIQGVAGTGKSHLVKLIAQAVRARRGATLSAAMYCKTAISYPADDKNTAHSIFGLPIFGPPPYYNRDRIRNAALITVDEGQLFRSGQIDRMLHCLDESLFLGVFVLLSNAKQAISVTPEWDLHRRLATNFTRAAGFNVFNEHTYVLERNMRMAGDVGLAEFISDLPHGTFPLVHASVLPSARTI